MGVRSRSAAVLERAGSAKGRASAQASWPVDPGTEAFVRAVKLRLQELYGSRLKQLILFGSRARGHFHEGSDADLAVVLEPPIGRAFAVKREIIDATYDLFLDSGIIIQPWPLCEHWLAAPEASPYPHLVRAVLREGIEL
ncbi:MAG TPA: nucleotidyltransferase domain-containing protein [Geminicoccaceae bacterium]|jgi:predicted nucleotidyltransferase|nr:nucleotidyltransferase domain-containing protein [Geminicoccaceae bacterium]